MPTASILLRLSKQAGDANLSLAGMRDDCLGIAARHGYEVGAVHVDDGVSGAVRDRPGFVAWLNDGREGRADALIAWSGDRLTREGVNAAALVLDVIEGKDPDSGARTRRPVRFLDCDGLDSAAPGDGFRFSFVIKAEIARGERERIVARNLATQRRLRAQTGRFRGGLPPYGYAVADRPEGGKTLVLDEAEACVVRGIAARVLGGESLYRVTADLNAEGVRTRTGSPWRIPTLQGLLTGDHSAGYVRHRGQVVRGEDGLPLRYFPAVLDDETLDRLRLVVRPPSTKRHAEDVETGPAPATARRKAKVSRLLSGLLVSSCCEGRVYAVGASPSKPRALYRQPNGQGCDLQVSINADPLDAHVEAEFLARFGRFDEVRPVRDSDGRADLAAIDRALSDTGRALAEPGADLPALMARLGDLHAQREEVASRPAAPATRLEPTGRTLAEAWEAGTFQSRNEILGQYLDGPISLAPVGRARSVKALDTARVSIPWRGTNPETADYLAGQTDEVT